MREDSEEMAALEAYVDAKVQRALDPHRATLPDDALAAIAEEMRCMLLSHPVAWRMLQRVRPRTVRAETGDALDANEASDGSAPSGEREVG